MMNDVKVSQIMTRMVVTLSPDQTIHEAAAKLADNGISGAPVVEDDRVIGMVSESDIIHAVAPSLDGRHRSILELLVSTRNMRPMHPSWGPLVRDVMSSMVVFQVEPDSSLWEAVSLLDRRGVKRLPVITSEGHLVGIVSRADIIRAFGRADQSIQQDVVDTLAILGPEAFRALRVEVRHGAATIRGEADRKSTKKIAIRLTKRVPGVIQVNDQLTFGADDSTLKVDFSQRDYENLNPFTSSAGKA